MGMPGGMVMACEPPDVPSLYCSVSDDPSPCAVTVPFVILELDTVPFVILDVAVPLVILPPPVTPGQSQPRLPSPVPRIDSGKTWTSTARCEPSGSVTDVIPRKLPSVRRARSD